MLQAMPRKRALLRLVFLCVPVAWLVSCGSSDSAFDSVVNVPAAAPHRCQIVVLGTDRGILPGRVFLDDSEERTLSGSPFALFDTTSGVHRVSIEDLGLASGNMMVRPGETVFLAVVAPRTSRQDWSGAVVGTSRHPEFGELQMVKLNRTQAMSYQSAAKLQGSGGQG